MTRLVLSAAFVATVWLANYLITTVGLVPVGFGLAAPAGVYAVGLTLGLRDLLHEKAGVRWVVGAILAGALLSASLSPALAVASGTAFLLSEAADLAVYAPLRRDNKALALAASNLVGAVVDSTVFLWLAFGSLEFLVGQIVGKGWVTVALVAAYQMARMRKRNGVQS